VTRMQTRSMAVARLLEQSAALDKARLAQAASDSAVRQFLLSGRDAPAARNALLSGWGRDPNARGRIELRNSAGLAILDTVQGVAPGSSGWVDRIIASRTLGLGETVLGPLHVAGDSVYTEAVVAISGTSGSTDSRPLGYVSHSAYLAAQGIQTLVEMIGVHAELRLGSPSNGVWTDFERVSRPPAAEVKVGHSTELDSSIGTAVAIGGTPWILWASQPRKTVFAPMRSVMAELCVLALLFIVLGVAGAWLFSRQISRPIVALADAAEKVAATEGASPPAAIDSHDEVARLTEAFSRMTARVNESRMELEQQVQEAQSLAGELEVANGELLAAVVAADEARNAAQAAKRAQTDFLAVMSHEVRTPLNAIIGYAELLRGGLSGPVTTDQKDKLARMRSSADELLHLVNQLLDVERIGGGQEPIHAEPTDIGGVLRDAASDIELKAAQHGLTLVIEEPEPSLTMSVDGRKLRQILVNLLSNAVKYTERGEVRVRARAMDGVLSLAVRDTGIGIDPAHHPRIFEPFWQVDQGLTRKVGGTGLGLTIVQRLTKLLGGDITVDSTPGHGSTFTVRLPVSVPELAAA
jgi:signal transduction histidine kinase